MGPKWYEWVMLGFSGGLAFGMLFERLLVWVEQRGGSQS